MNEQQPEVREPTTESRERVQAAPGTAPATPIREREQEAPDDDRGARNTEATDERAATRTEPIAQTPADRQEPAGGQAPGTDRSRPLIQDQRWEYFAGRWDEVQSGFVDDPRRTVEQADRLVAEVIDQLSKMFREERARLESQWSKDGKVETEDLRLTMQRYREFFRTLVGR